MGVFGGGEILIGMLTVVAVILAVIVLVVLVVAALAFSAAAVTGVNLGVLLGDRVTAWMGPRAARKAARVLAPSGCCCGGAALLFPGVPLVACVWFLFQLGELRDPDLELIQRILTWLLGACAVATLGSAGLVLLRSSTSLVGLAAYAIRRRPRGPVHLVDPLAPPTRAPTRAAPAPTPEGGELHIDVPPPDETER